MNIKFCIISRFQYFVYFLNNKSISDGTPQYIHIYRVSVGINQSGYRLPAPGSTDSDSSVSELFIRVISSRFPHQGIGCSYILFSRATSVQLLILTTITRINNKDNKNLALSMFSLLFIIDIFAIRGSHVNKLI